MITIKEISTKKELTAFVKFQFTLYKNNPYWVPPIIKEEVNSFDKDQNPVFEHAIARFFLAYNNNKIVGRVAAIINWIEINEQKIRKMRFGWFDFIDDPEVSKALLHKVNEIGKENKLEIMEGPVGFSNIDQVGFITFGYEEMGSMMTWYNYPYYIDHMEKHGFETSKKFIETYFYIKDIDISNYDRFANIIEKRYDLEAINFTSTAQILPHVQEMFALFNISYADLPSFVPISQKQIEYFKKKFISFIDPEYIKFVRDKNGKLVSFAITMPSFSKALRKANGKLFPTGFLHLLKAKKSNDEAVFFLIGILPEYRKKGVTAIVFREYFKTYLKKGIKKAISTPELEENKDIQLIWKNFKPVNHIKRSTFLKNIEYY